MYEGTFAEFDKVYEVIAVVVKEKNLVEGDTFELAFDGTVLSNDTPLSDLGLKDGSVLDLIASGSAV